MIGNDTSLIVDGNLTVNTPGKKTVLKFKPVSNSTGEGEGRAYRTININSLSGTLVYPNITITGTINFPVLTTQNSLLYPYPLPGTSILFDIRKDEYNPSTGTSELVDTTTINLSQLDRTLYPLSTNIHFFGKSETLKFSRNYALLSSLKLVNPNFTNEMAARRSMNIMFPKLGKPNDPSFISPIVYGASMTSTFGTDDTLKLDETDNWNSNTNPFWPDSNGNNDAIGIYLVLPIGNSPIQFYMNGGMIAIYGHGILSNRYLYYRPSPNAYYYNRLAYTSSGIGGYFTNAILFRIS